MKFIEKIGYKSTAHVRAKLGNIRYYPFHMHDDAIEILCVLDGQIDISDSAASYKLGYGDVHIFNMNDPHRIQASDDNIILTVHVDFKSYRKPFPDLPDPPYFISDGSYEKIHEYPSDMRLLRFYLAQLFVRYNEQKSDLALEQCAEEMFALLVESFQNYRYIESEYKIANIVHSQPSAPLGRDYSRMYRVVDYIYDHYKEKLTLKQMADMEYVSTSHMSRYLHDTLGLTFSHQVSLARCEEAARLLSGTSKTVDQIASDTGFCNRKHLTSHFKRWYCKTPAEYRGEILKDLNTDSNISFRPFDYDHARTLIEMYLDEY